MNRPLDSTRSTLECLRTAARERDGHEELVRNIGFDDWQELEEFARHAGVLIDDNTVVFRRQLSVSRADAWHFISQPAELAKWHIPTEWDFREGGRFEFKNAWSGIIETLRPGWMIKFRADEGGSTTFEFAVSEYATEFVLTDFMGPDVVVPEHVLGEGETAESQQPGGPGSHWHGVLSGWHCGVDAFEALVGGSAAEMHYDKYDSVYELLLNARYKS